MSNSKKIIKRCSHEGCNKKIKLSDIKCGYCDAFYCQKHRLPETHSCKYDFKTEHAKKVDEIANKMRCVASKIDMINA